MRPTVECALSTLQAEIANNEPVNLEWDDNDVYKGAAPFSSQPQLVLFKCYHPDSPPHVRLEAAAIVHNESEYIRAAANVLDRRADDDLKDIMPLKEVLVFLFFFWLLLLSVL